jgi:hypothetical protein
MASLPAFPSLKAREPRISVVAPVRLRVGARWSDACILNVSSKGLLIRSAEAVDRGSYVELRRADNVIIARVVWRSGSRLGLRAQDRVPVEAIVTSKAVQPGAGETPRLVERRRVSRDHERSRACSRAVEFASVTAIAATFCVVAYAMVAEAFAVPLARVGTALEAQASLSADSR